MDSVPFFGQSKKAFIQMNPNFSKNEDIDFKQSFNLPNNSKGLKIHETIFDDEAFHENIQESIEMILTSIENAENFFKIKVNKLKNYS